MMELEKYRKESNRALVFLDECCDLDQKAVCSSSQLYEKYQEFCKNNGLRNMSQPKFNSTIELSKPFVFKGKDKVSRRTIWNGIRILT